MRVEAVDAQTASDDLLRRIVEREVSYDFRTAEETIAFMRNPPSDERRLHWLAFDGDEPVGMARLRVHAAHAWLNICVLPEHRRRGVGRALLEAARAEADGKPIGAHHAEADGEAFARAMGARDEQRDVRSTLELRTAALADAPVPEGYRLRSWTGAAPDDLVESYCAAHDALDDAPTPEGEEHAPLTVDRLRDLEAAVSRRGRQLRATVALAGGAVVAFTELRVSLPRARVASTEDTATVAEHRGRGLCRAVKTESLRLLRAERPDVELVTTLNAELNGPMRAVNTSLGFVPVATLTTAYLRP